MAFLSDLETPSVSKRLNRSLGHFLNSVVTARKLALGYDTRIARMDALNAKTDEELAELGLQRTDIARHVFRDLYHF